MLVKLVVLLVCGSLQTGAVSPPSMFQKLANEVHNCTTATYDVPSLTRGSITFVCDAAEPFSSNNATWIQKELEFHISTFICSTVFYNVRTLCNSTAFPAVPSAADPSTDSCSRLAKLQIGNCSTGWLKDREDCLQTIQLLQALQKPKTCAQECTLKKNPLCEELATTSARLSQGPDAPPGLGKPEVKPMHEGESSNIATSVKSHETGKSTPNRRTVAASENIEARKSLPNQNTGADAAKKVLRNESFSSSSKEAKNKKLALESQSGVSQQSSSISSFNMDTGGAASSAVDRENSKEIPGPEKKEDINIDVGNANTDKDIVSQEESQKDENESEIKASDNTNPPEKENSNSDSEKNKESKQPEEDNPPAPDPPLQPSPAHSASDTEQSLEISNEFVNPSTSVQADSSFFSYFIMLSGVAIAAYLVFHNKQKILALILEGRRRQGDRRRSGGREYRKLDSNLQDAMELGGEKGLKQGIY